MAKKYKLPKLKKKPLTNLQSLGLQVLIIVVWIYFIIKGV